MPDEHSRFGYSAVSSFEQCPYQYKLRHIDNLKTFSSDDPSNALIVGTAMHTGIEKDIQTAIDEYFMSYPIITDEHINEAIKLEYLLLIVKSKLPEGTHEVKIKDKNFIGTMDLIVPVGDEFYDLYDFKYSNNWIHYKDSRQLHVYKYYAEKTLKIKIRNMYFVMIPKVSIRQKKTEDIFQFRKRLQKELEKVKDNVKIEPVTYDQQKVIEHLELCQDILTTENFEKNPTRLCDWCEFKKYCYEGNDVEMLPSTERVQTNMSENKKIWIYGVPFSGKTTVCDAAPTPLNLNTDGNVKGVTMARLPIKDTLVGRQTKLAWEVFEEAVDELEKGSDFETVIVDLVEDVYLSCRLWLYDQRKIEHESDDVKTWDIVRTKFLSTMKRLMNLPYNIVLISHEDMTKDIFKKSGDKVTAIKPNIQDKVANKLAGMVDVVCRVIVEDSGKRFLSFKTDGVQFGGGRLKDITTTQIPLSWDDIEAFYASLDGQNTPKKEVVEDNELPQGVDEKPSESVPVEPEDLPTEPVTERPTTTTRRTRRTRG